MAFRRICVYDKDPYHPPRHSSFMIMHTFAKWGGVRYNMAESLGITTVSTTKAHGWNQDKGNGMGREILSSKGLLRGCI